MVQVLSSTTEFINFHGIKRRGEVGITQSIFIVISCLVSTIEYIQESQNSKKVFVNQGPISLMFNDSR